MTKKTILIKHQILLLVLIISAIQFITQSATAQVNIPFESAKIQQAYKNPAYLSFNIKYTYAYETAPATILDSSTGSFKISGTYYWGSIDSTEFMQNSSYSVIAYKPGKLMNINNPTTMYPQVANFSALDSLLGKSGYTSTLTNSGANKLITLTFTDPNNPYKNFKVYYDSTSNLVTQVFYTIREEFLAYEDNYNESSSGSSSPYIIVKADYTNYQTTAFSNTIFMASNYFVITGGVYYPQAPYTGYEVFLAAPNLFLTPEQIQ